MNGWMLKKVFILLWQTKSASENLGDSYLLATRAMESSWLEMCNADVDSFHFLLCGGMVWRWSPRKLCKKRKACHYSHLGNFLFLGKVKSWRHTKSNTRWETRTTFEMPSLLIRAHRAGKIGPSHYQGRKVRMACCKAKREAEGESDYFPLMTSPN